jgi:hypothetical protein
MSETFRHCPECGTQRLFEQHHPAAGSCPDAADGNCPEWACTGCGTALLAGFVLYQAGTAAAGRMAGRVA